MTNDNITYNNLIFSFKDLSERFKSLLESPDISLPELNLISQEFDGLIQLLDDPIISQPLDNFELSKVNKIDLLSLGKDVLGYYKSGQSYFQIARMCTQQSGESITKKDVEEWIKEFDQRSISGKQRVVYGSIFDTTDRLEEIYIAILQLRETIKNRDSDYYKNAKVVKEQIELETLRELRQLVSEAEKLASKIQMAEDIRRFTNLVLQCLKKEAPLVHTRVLTLLRQEQAAFKQLVSS